MTLQTIIRELLLLFSDDVALLSGTLKTYQRASCNEEFMTLKCPIGTAILVTVARYGRATIDSSGKCSTNDPNIDDNHLNSTCLFPSVLQVRHNMIHYILSLFLNF